MRVQYFLSVLLSVFFIACQRGVDRMHMDKNQLESPVEVVGSLGLALTQGSIDKPINENDQLSSSPNTFSSSSDSSSGASLIVEQEHCQDDRGTVSAKAKPDFKTWFQEFVDVLHQEKERDSVVNVLEKGRCYGYLDESISWNDGIMYTPLHYAAGVGNMAAIKELVNTYSVPVDIEVGTHRESPLHVAAQEGHLEVVRALIEEYSAQLSKEDISGSHALHYAASGEDNNASTEIVKYLIKERHVCPLTKGSSGFNILYMAIKVNNPVLVGYLVNAFPQLTIDRYNNDTPLNFAKTLGRMTIVGIMQEAVRNFSHFNAES